MEQITLRLPAEVKEEVEEEADEHDQSRSEYLRDVVESRNEHERLRAELEDLQDELDRIRREKRQILDERTEKKELAKWAESKADIEERRRRAPAWERAKWWLLGDGQ